MKRGRNNLWIKIAVFSFPFLLLTAVFFGCSLDSTVNSPVESHSALATLQCINHTCGPDLFTGIEQGDQRDSLAREKVFHLSSDSSVALVGDNGGTLLLEFSHGNSEFEIPEGAVCDDGGETSKQRGSPVEITARAALFATHDGPLVVYDFAPRGLTFPEKCTLRLQTTFGFNEDITLYRWNPDTGDWIKGDQTRRIDKDGAVEFKIDRFSKCAIR